MKIYSKSLENQSTAHASDLTFVKFGFFSLLLAIVDTSAAPGLYIVGQ